MYISSFLRYFCLFFYFQECGRVMYQKLRDTVTADCSQKLSWSYLKATSLIWKNAGILNHYGIEKKLLF